MQKLNPNYKAFFLTSIFILLMLISWKCPLTSNLWQSIDIRLAYFFNSFIRYSAFAQNFWAFFNSSTADWLFDGVVLLFFLPYIFSHEKPLRLRAFIEVLILVSLFYILHVVFTICILKKLIVSRCSPSWTLELFDLSSVIHWTFVKVRSKSSFPSDHAYTVLISVISVFHLRGWKWGIYAFIISIPFLLPRSITGAHWFTDVFMGGFLISLFFLACIFYTGFLTYLTNRIFSFFKERKHGKNLR